MKENLKPRAYMQLEPDSELKWDENLISRVKACLPEKPETANEG